jgi:hypothetical protein
MCSFIPRKFARTRNAVTNLEVGGAGWLAWNPMRRRSVHGLDGAATLFRSHLTPLLAQLHAPLRRHLAEPIERFAHFPLPLRRQRLEFLIALTQQLPLLRRHGAPLTESLLRAGPLLRRHRYPALAAFRQRLLPLRRQAFPLALIALQQLLLLRRQRSPRARGCGYRGSGRGRRIRPGRRRSLREAGGSAQGKARADE